MDYETVELASGEGFSTLCFNRPDALNALNEKMKFELLDALQTTEKDENCRVLVLSARGKAFCAGADLDRLRDARVGVLDPKVKSNFGSLDFPEAFIRYPKPLIAAINGPCHGFGATVSLTCDIRVASDRAEFGFGFVRLGLTPEFGSSFFLPRLVGSGKTAELMMTARTVKADEALEIGLVNSVFPHDRLMPEVLALAGRIAAFPASALRRTKEVLRYGLTAGIDPALSYEIGHFMESVRSEEHAAALERLVAKVKGPKP